MNKFEEMVLKRRTVSASLATSLAAISFIVGIGVTLPNTAIAQGQFPQRAITMIVPFPPGGLADLVARPVAEAMARDLGQAVVIENRAGAGGGIGMGAKAKPDGHTILMALSSLTVIPEADALLGRAPLFALAALPDLPSLKEAGQAVEYAQWSGLFIPSATPEAVAQRLRAAASFAASDARVKEVIQNAGSPVQYKDASDFEKYVQDDARRMVDVVKRIGKLN